MSDHLEQAAKNAIEFLHGAAGVPKEKKRRPIPLTEEDIELLKMAVQTVAGQTGNEHTRRMLRKLRNKLDGKEQP